jgi:hypothetical protein
MQTRAQMRSTAQKILQMSYMELLYEGASPEPRLRRLLGHVSTYENTSNWCQEDKKKNFSYVDDEKDKASEEGRVENDGHQNGDFTRDATQVEHVRRWSEFQATIQSQLQHQQLVVVTAEEVTEGSDEKYQT